MAKKQRRGFAAMAVKKHQGIASAGGKAAQEKGSAHRWEPEESSPRSSPAGLARAVYAAYYRWQDAEHRGDRTTAAKEQQTYQARFDQLPVEYQGLVLQRRDEKYRKQRALSLGVAEADALIGEQLQVEIEPMATEQQRRGAMMIAQLVNTDVEAAARRGVQKPVMLAPFTGRDALRGVYDATVMLALQLRSLIEEEAVTRSARAHTPEMPTASAPATGRGGESEAMARVMAHRNIDGRCQFCDEPFPCGVVRGVGR